jgi:hypothetical protein
MSEREDPVKEFERLRGIERAAQALIVWIDEDIFSGDAGVLRRFRSLKLALSAKAERSENR